MSPEYFDNQMRRLGVLRFPPADISGHRTALADLPEDVLEAAVSHALKTRREFPVPAELRADADHVSAPAVDLEEDRSVSLAQPFTITVPQVGTVVSVTREWKYYCETCSDSGWQACWCGETPAKPWYEMLACGRQRMHLEHEWVRRCVCVETNPALVRKREKQRTYAEAPKKIA